MTYALYCYIIISGVRTMNEIWKPIKNYEGLYEASNLGRIRSLDREQVFVVHGSEERRRGFRGRVLTPIFDGRGLYQQVSLCKNGKSKRFLVHRIIAQTFIKNPQNLPEVNHKDEDKTNNAAYNLEWCDHKYNNNYGSKKMASNGEKNAMNKFSADLIKEIRESYIPRDKEFGATALSKKYGISITHIVAISKGRRWGWM